MPGNQNPELPETKGISNAWIIAIIIIVAIIVGIVVMLKRRKI
ncbi:LPXTG cell wall anchor domain-containing protein [Candidatus Pacearchaeota archaeon]|nr:LPXTG cell wall anchor domain-containing protein [Candidatus Pacearchaeota archaeon]